MNWRDALLVVGVAAALVGLGVAFVPSLGGLIESPAAIPLLLGVVALLAALVRTRTWIGHEERSFELAERERPSGVGAPGQAFEDRLSHGSGRAAGGNTRLIMVRQDLREAAIDALTTYHGHTPETAERAVESGTWTDDELAVEFFTTTGGAGTSLSESVTSTFYGEGPFHRRADRAAREIERLTRGDR